MNDDALPQIRIDMYCALCDMSTWTFPPGSHLIIGTKIECPNQRYPPPE
jgi:hypothetical protein